MVVLLEGVLVRAVSHSGESPKATLGCCVCREDCCWPKGDPVREVPRTGESPEAALSCGVPPELDLLEDVLFYVAIFGKNYQLSGCG